MNYSQILTQQIPVDDECLLENVKNDFKRNAKPLLVFRELIKNSLESIKLKNKKIQNKIGYDEGALNIDLFFKNDLLGEKSVSFLEKIIISDNGIGFDKENFERFAKYSSNKKGFNNKGTARFYLLGFEDNVYESTYSEDGKKKFVEFSFSEKNEKKSCYIKIIQQKEVDATKNLETKITITNSDAKSYKYDLLNASVLKDYILQTFLLDFISNKENLPSFTINEYIDGTKTKSESISKDNLPVIDFEQAINLNYYSLTSGEKNKIIPVATDNTENFKLEFIKSEKIDTNSIILFSNGVKCDEYNIPILRKDETINNQRIFILVTGEILDKECNYNNERNGFNILLSDEEINQNKKDLFGGTKDFLKVDDLFSEVSKILYEKYSDIKIKKEEILKKFEDITNVFCVDEEITKKIRESIKIDSTATEIINSISEQERKKIAKLNNELYSKLETIKTIDTTSNDSEKKIEELATEILDLIPQQNKNELSKYVARRKIILELFSKMINNNMEIINNKTEDKQNILEKHFHNLVLKQHAKNNEDTSNLWIINEEFIYFDGCSEEKLEDLKLEDGTKIFKSEFFEEEKKYLESFGENRLEKRPDILLFPETNKCIIIELKKPNINPKNYIAQINYYAGLIKSFTDDKVKFDLFYGYLIGDNFDFRDIILSDTDFKYSYNNEYLFRPNKDVVNINDIINGDRGSLYMEVHTYSSLLKMAEIKNKIFMTKLGLCE